MECAGFERWTTRSETGDIILGPQMFDYIAAIFATYILIHFVGDIQYRISLNLIKKLFKKGLST